MSDEDYSRQYKLIGETIIIKTLSNVNYLLMNSQNYANKEGRMREIRKKQCLKDLSFFHNGGVDNIIELFQLDLDADTLYQTFYYKVRHR